MLRPADTVVLFGLVCGHDDWTLRSLASRLGVAHPKVQRAIARLGAAGLYDSERRGVIPHAADEFVIHALKFLHPISEGPLARGVPTAWGAEPLVSELGDPDDVVPVWPSALGSVRGPSIEPLDPVLPTLVSAWPAVAELAALSDALRIGDRRTRDAAAEHVHRRLLARA